MAMTLRLPPDLQEQAAELAQYLGCSLNALTIQALRNFIEYRNRQRPARAGLQATTATASTKGLVSRTTTTALAATAPRPSPASGNPTIARSSVARVGANQPCPCGSGKKYKRCHGR